MVTIVPNVKAPVSKGPRNILHISIKELANTFLSPRTFMFKPSNMISHQQRLGPGELGWVGWFFKVNKV